MKNEIIQIFIRLRTNSKGYLYRNRYYLAVLLLAAIADVITTIMFMMKLGPNAEYHPAIRFVSGIFGPLFGPIIGKICQLLAILLVTLYLKNWEKYVLVVVSILYAWAAWFNVWGKHIYVPKFMYFL